MDLLYNPLTNGEGNVIWIHDLDPNAGFLDLPSADKEVVISREHFPLKDANESPSMGGHQQP